MKRLQWVLQYNNHKKNMSCIYRTLNTLFIYKLPGRPTYIHISHTAAYISLNKFKYFDAYNKMLWSLTGKSRKFSLPLEWKKQLRSTICSDQESVVSLSAGM